MWCCLWLSLSLHQTEALGEQAQGLIIKISSMRAALCCLIHSYIPVLGMSTVPGT